MKPRERCNYEICIFSFRTEHSLNITIAVKFQLSYEKASRELHKKNIFDTRRYDTNLFNFISPQHVLPSTDRKLICTFLFMKIAPQIFWKDSFLNWSEYSFYSLVKISWTFSNNATWIMDVAVKLQRYIFVTRKQGKLQKNKIEIRRSAYYGACGEPN